ncbi:hypothetical protein BKA69DRAFT_1064874 [Paraphysoderma sedebokerense]|nr:hypothetical protein BKA69DRAFT_1064874 [Paraphysoderma sedebokerense]
MFGGPRIKLNQRQRNWWIIIMSLPIAIVSTKILIERTFFGKEQRKLEGPVTLDHLVLNKNKDKPKEP